MLAKTWSIAIITIVTIVIFDICYVASKKHYEAPSFGFDRRDGGVAARPTMSPMEEIFLSVPSSDSARKSLRYITHRSHVAGTKGDYMMANYVRKEFRAAGIPNVSLFELDVYLTYPESKPRVSLLLLEKQNATVESSVTTATTTTNTRNLSSSSSVGSVHSSSSDASIQSGMTYNSSSVEHNNNDTNFGSNDYDGNKVFYEAKLSEDMIESDPTSDTYWRNHTFHGYSPSGTMTAPAIYANYGRPEDFGKLQNAGIDVTGKIVIVRYGKCFRGLKVMNAQSLGAKAVLIYSDPADDGYRIGNVYPNGPWRPPSSIQRGSVQFNSICAGDPMRIDPRYSSSSTGNNITTICGVKNYTELIPRIPSLPMSYQDMEPILQHLGGKLAYDVGGDDFVGGLDNLTYRVGPSNSQENVHKTVLRVSVRNKGGIRSIPNVIGMIPGKLYHDKPEEDMPVLLGNHRDAWVFGAADPNSGTSALLEVAKGFGKLLSTGWKPLRTIYLLSWSGEEYGLLGSTGWAELEFSNKSQQQLKRTLAYLNVDTLVSGTRLEVSATPSLIPLWKQVIHDLKQHATTSTNINGNYHNTSNASNNNDNNLLSTLLEEVMDANINYPITTRDNDDNNNNDDNDNAKNKEKNVHNQHKRKLVRQPNNNENKNKKIDSPALSSSPFSSSPPPRILGSGSDYTVFLDHFGVSSLDFRFKTPHAAQYGVYHSIYDSFNWIDNYGGANGDNDDDDDDDNNKNNNTASSFEFISLGSKIWGLLAIRLSSAEYVPLDHKIQGDALYHYLTIIKDQEFYRQNSYTLDTLNLEKAVLFYKEMAANLSLVCSNTSTNKYANYNNKNSGDGNNIYDTIAVDNYDKNSKDNRVALCNKKLGLSERQFLTMEGLPNRPWFKHVLQAPGLYLGYAAEAFPGIQQAFNDGNVTLAQIQINIVTERIQSAAKFMSTS